MPACQLVMIEIESVSGDSMFVHALDHPAGSYRIVVHAEDGNGFDQPFEHSDGPLPLGELLRLLDETSAGMTSSVSGTRSGSALPKSTTGLTS
jgi:hypothetical protein